MEDQPFKLVAKINIGLFHTNHEKARRVVKDVADMPYSKARMVKTFQGSFELSILTSLTLIC